jgi:nucleotide-binding universal stress UspA family protein
MTLIRTILVAVDDTAAALAGARFAVDLAASCGATIHALAVSAQTQPPEPDEGIGGTERTASAVLDYVVRLSRQAGVRAETAVKRGEPAARILAHAREVKADIVVLGRSGLAGLGQPYIGSQTRHVLEFTEWPVVVVPADRPQDAGKVG